VRRKDHRNSPIRRCVTDRAKEWNDLVWFDAQKPCGDVFSELSNRL
jgi:hypothetical protein